MLSVALVLLLLSLSGGQALVFPSQCADDAALRSRTSELNVAILFQGWDYMDLLLRTFTAVFYQARFAEMERAHNITCNLYFFWDSREGGDVQDGKLESLHIDVAFGPGGVGSWNTPPGYGEKIRQFVLRGGGFLGACGDAYLGTMGAINVPEDYDDILYRLFGFQGMTPPLEMVNVYFDAGPFAQHFEPRYTQNNFYVLLFLLTFFVSQAQVRFAPQGLPFAEAYANKTVSIMESGVPMVEAPPDHDASHPSFYPIATFAGVRSLYDASLFENKYAIVAGPYGEGKVVLSAVHPEISMGNRDAHRIFAEMILWLSA